MTDIDDEFDSQFIFQSNDNDYTKVKGKVTQIIGYELEFIRTMSEKRLNRSSVIFTLRSLALTMIFKPNRKSYFQIFLVIPFISIERQKS